MKGNTSLGPPLGPRTRCYQLSSICSLVEIKKSFSKMESIKHLINWNTCTCSSQILQQSLLNAKNIPGYYHVYATRKLHSMTYMYYNLRLHILLKVWGPPKKSPVSGHRSASKSVRWRVFLLLFFFCHLFWGLKGKYVTHCIRGEQIFHIQSMVAKRGLTNWSNVHTPMWKSRLKHSTAEFQSIQQF